MQIDHRKGFLELKFRPLALRRIEKKIWINIKYEIIVMDSRFKLYDVYVKQGISRRSQSSLHLSDELVTT